MAEYLVTITQEYMITARNQEQAEERAQQLEDVTMPTNLKIRWQWEMQTSTSAVEEQ